MKSKLLRLNISDGLKGIVVAIITALISGVYEIIIAGGAFDWITLKPVLLTAIAAGLSYIIKNFLTNSNDQLLTKELKR